MTQSPNYDQFEFFMPGEVCFFFKRPPEDNSDILSLFREHPKLRELSAGAGFETFAAQTFLGGEGYQANLSIIRAQMPVPASFYDSGRDDRDRLNIRVIKFIEEVNASVVEEFQDIGLTAVTPNWLSGASQLLVNGGPGARPVDAQKLPDNLEKVTDVIDRAGLLRTQTVQESPSVEVDVYVLDTIPLPSSWAWLATQQPSNRMNGLLGKMTFTTATDLGVTLPNYHFQIGGHQYEMSDHGLFIAGLIHDVAPCANIHLIEVLNKYGVGNLFSLLAGLLAIPTNLQRPTVINCSLMMAVTSSSLIARYPFWSGLVAAEPEDTNIKDPKQQKSNTYLERLMTPLGEIIEQRIAVLTSNRCVKFVAAAGNDSVTGNRLAARFPAAFRSVIGVGALSRDNATPQPYSNWADKPVSDGIEVYGGDENPATPDDADPTAGIAGLYIGDLPQTAARTQKGTARWAGTSFAAGVVSGMLARLMCEGTHNCDDLENLVREQIKALRENKQSAA